MTSTDTGQTEPVPAPPTDWRIYRGTGQQHDDITRLPQPPGWRRFAGQPVVDALPTSSISPRHLPSMDERAKAYVATDEVVDMVNAALYLRRPLLVTGKPGTGKSSLAYSIAYELQLGPVLYWPITSRSTLADGLYGYDAIGRLQESSLRATVGEPGDPPDIGRYVQLGALGTALLPRTRPRVLLIDELDKSDIDLPNDLLNIFEEGYFDISELARLPADQHEVSVMTADGQGRVPVHAGRVSCQAFPVVVITSNGEREFPPAFLRRCLRLNMMPLGENEMAKIVTSLLGSDAAAASGDLIRDFVERRERGELATDQLLNAIFLVRSRPPDSTRDRLVDAVLRPLDPARPV